MRVIAGSARRLSLKTVDSMDTRPTTDRIKETLFNILQNDIEDANVLDLFAGSGGIGIEALSRGAKEAVFVDNSKEAVKCINYNLEFTKLKDKSFVLECDALTGISRLEGRGKYFDIVFMDPPYNNLLEQQVLKRLKKSSIIDENTLIIIEAEKRTDFSYLSEEGYTPIREKIYKTNKHVFVVKKSD